jgi:hypothetical protein
MLNSTFTTIKDKFMEQRTVSSVRNEAYAEGLRTHHSNHLPATQSCALLVVFPFVTIRLSGLAATVDQTLSFGSLLPLSGKNRQG